MRIVVFDQSSAKTGYAIFSGTDLTRWGVIDKSKTKDTNKRTKEMCQQIDTIISKSKPDLVIFEDVNVQRSVKVGMILSRLQGCIIMSCYLKNIEFARYLPTAWRKIIGIEQSKKIKREKLKEQAIAFVRAGYGIEVGDDCAEAICIGLAHLKKENLLPDLNNIKTSNKKEKTNGKKSV